MAKTVRKSSEEHLKEALNKLVMVCPNKKTYDDHGVIPHPYLFPHRGYADELF